jgi:predicted glycosyltransferase
MKMYLLFSHKLTDAQIKDAKKLGVNEFVYLPEDLQQKWSNVPPELERIKEYAKDFEEFLKSAQKGDYVLIQGDFGLTCHMVNFSKNNGLIPVYATTKRISKDINQNGKIIKISEFQHIRFRMY